MFLPMLNHSFFMLFCSQGQIYDELATHQFVKALSYICIANGDTLMMI